MSTKLSIDVCFALPGAQMLVSVELAPGATVQQAIDASGILARHPEIDSATLKVGIYGKIRPLDATVADHDRVEIYRPLIVDPKAARQRRVDKTRKAGSVEGRKWLPRDSR